MRITFWGVRGSVPVPGEKTVRIGGNTSCVEFVTDEGEIILFDAGTGLREFGLDYLGRKGVSRTLHLMISHVHWDHIQGLPFFVPGFLGDVKLHIYGYAGLEEYLCKQMSAPFFPVPMGAMRAAIEFHVIGNEPLEVAGCDVSAIALTHPQEVLGYRVRSGGRSVVFSTDTESDVGVSSEYMEFISGADVLMIDAQYTPEQYAGRSGWGHGTYRAAAEIANAAGVGRLVLFHHEPTHDDDTVLAIEAKARELCAGAVAAREGMTIEI